MADFGVVQTVRVGRSARHILRARVTGVPDGVSLEQVTDALTEAGLAPAEYGIEWANHRVVTGRKADEAESAGPVDVRSWREVAKPKPSQLNVRIPPRLHARCESAASSGGLTLRQWVEKALTEAVERSEGVSS